MMNGETARGTFNPDSDVEITFEDQQRINKFARLNAKCEDLKEELKSKKREMENLEDAESEIELADESEVIPFQTGEIFICKNIEDTQKSINDIKKQLLTDFVSIEMKINSIAEQMSDLKTVLYAKFGEHINLEPDS